MTSAAPYAELDRETFDRAVQFVATGGYALKTYERYAKIRQTDDGSWRITHPRIAQQYRMNAGTIIEAPMLEVRMTKAPGRRSSGSKAQGQQFRGGKRLGKIEEGFLESLSHGDTFMFSGRIVRFEGIQESTCYVSNAEGSDPKVPSYAAASFRSPPIWLTGVRAILADPSRLERPARTGFRMAAHSALCFATAGQR